MIIQHAYADINQIRLHYAYAGTGRLVLFLHGFPEFWYVWRKQLATIGEEYLAVAPDLRGYNLSAKPADPAAYALPTLVEDIAALIAHFGQQRASLVGHDWGGVIAWECARTRPDLVEKLVVVNAPHPELFRRELAQNPAQQAASAYMTLLRSPQAEALLSANGYAALLHLVIEPGMRQGYFDAADRHAYLEAWSQPGALVGGLNYYRAADFVPGMPAASALPRKIVATPTLLIWGEADTALLIGNLEGIEEYVPDIRIERIPEATHAILHEQPELISTRIRAFLHE